jgi:uncharacterized membrane protein
MTVLRRYGLALVFTAAALAIAAIAYQRLPEQVPVHWNLRGVADGSMPKLLGAFIIPALTVILTALLIMIEPRAVRSASSGSMPRVYPKVVATVSGFLLFITAVVVSAGMGAQLSVPSFAAIGLGVLLVVIGNLAGKMTRNSVMGIRTPWTLASDEVWLRTHRIGGWIAILAGIGAALSGIAGYGLAVALIIVLTAAAVSVASSYVIYGRVQSERSIRK